MNITGLYGNTTNIDLVNINTNQVNCSTLNSSNTNTSNINVCSLTIPNNSITQNKITDLDYIIDITNPNIFQNLTNYFVEKTLKTARRFR